MRVVFVLRVNRRPAEDLENEEMPSGHFARAGLSYDSVYGTVGAGTHTFEEEAE